MSKAQEKKLLAQVEDGKGAHWGFRAALFIRIRTEIEPEATLSQVVELLADPIEDLNARGLLVECLSAQTADIALELLVSETRGGPLRWGFGYKALAESVHPDAGLALATEALAWLERTAVAPEQILAHNDNETAVVLHALLRRGDPGSRSVLLTIWRRLYALRGRIPVGSYTPPFTAARVYIDLSLARVEADVAASFRETLPTIQEPLESWQSTLDRVHALVPPDDPA